MPEITALDGAILVDKPTGWTSHDVVAKIRHILGGIKVGHAGTLDPAATGVLPVLIGKGTRIVQYLVEWDKEYRAVLRLGETADTQDATGKVLARQPTEGVTAGAIHEAVARFRGTVEQVPPMYSAVKVGGVPLYKSARAGKTVTRQARTVVIQELDVTAIDGRDVTLRIACSKGTYVRTLCADIGNVLGVGGHLLTLERCRVGPLSLDQSRTVDEIAMRQAIGRLEEDVIPLDRALQQLPAVTVDQPTADRVRHGASVPLSSVRWTERGDDRMGKSGMPVRIHDATGRLLAIGTYPKEPGARLAIEKVLTSQE